MCLIKMHKIQLALIRNHSMPEQRLFRINVLSDFIKPIAEHRAIEYLMCFDFRTVQVNFHDDYLIVLIDSDIPSNQVCIRDLAMEFQYFPFDFVPHGNGNSMENFSRGSLGCSRIILLNPVIVKRTVLLDPYQDTSGT